MFYFPEVLQRHTGCFSTIWLAATKGIKITRIDLLNVNVRWTCQDIMNYVMVQVPAPHPNQPRPRFSLYLSSQLQYGVVIVYHRQCGFALQDAKQMIERLVRTERRIHINMAEPDRKTIDVPDYLFLMEATEGAQDPFFGLMEHDQLLSPYKIYLPVFLMEEVVSQHSLVTSHRNTSEKGGFRSPLDAITLKEKEQLVINTAEVHFEGAELPEATDKEINLLMDEQEEFHRDMETERQAEEGERSKEFSGAMTSVDVLKETVLGPDLDVLYLFDKVTRQPMEVPLADVPMEMTPPQVSMPVPPTEEKEGDSERDTESTRKFLWRGEDGCLTKKRRKGRSHQLVFADPQVQISDRAMKKQIGEPLSDTLTLSEVLEVLATTRLAPPAQLLTSPSRSASDVVLDVSKDDKSLSDPITPASRWSPQEEPRMPMEPIMEEYVELPEVQTEFQNMGIPANHLLSLVSSRLQRFGEVTFDSLLPLEADRITAANTLAKLLELVSARELAVQQNKPYKTITITYGLSSMAT
ncbi:REC8 meiotic recombination protein b [Lampris incognitus]|uniref:REC8 meiotic recombination protein b n=1 Tax=Lampris incognitus TaxID=2546036 RepID=UPI0024B56707|nr:REC8 meiotic recombination protein b [Lampris incognitus]